MNNRTLSVNSDKEATDAMTKRDAATSSTVIREMLPRINTDAKQMSETISTLLPNYLLKK